jgi:hypothetical protein
MKLDSYVGSSDFAMLYGVIIGNRNVGCIIPGNNYDECIFA